MSRFKDEHSLEERKRESEKMKAKYPDRIPIICEKNDRSDIPDIDKKKYLVPNDLNVGQFIYVIRKRVRLPAEKAIFIYVNRHMPPAAELLATVYEHNKDEDGFLYIEYSAENTYGSA